MRSGYTLAPVKETKSTNEETILINTVIREEYTTAISEWVINQKPKLRGKFKHFLEEILDAPTPSYFSAESTDLAERIARDVCKREFHAVLRTVIDDSQGEFSDVIHILSNHISRKNVVQAVQRRRDPATELIKATAQEDHILSRPYQPKHDMPHVQPAKPLTRERMNEPPPRVIPTRSCKPDNTRTSPFAIFPTSGPMETTYRSEFQNYEGKYVRPERSSVYNVVNAPTCL